MQVMPLVAVNAIIGTGSLNIEKRGDRAHEIRERTLMIPNDVAVNKRGKTVLCAIYAVLREDATPSLAVKIRAGNTHPSW